MKTILKPQEYCYLESPWNSDAGQMVKYALQGLCVNADINIITKHIFIHKNAKYKRKRIYLRLNEKNADNTNYTSAEKFLLGLFNKPEMSIPYLKQRLLEELDDKVQKFKTEYVYADVKRKGLCTFRYFLTGAGRSEKKNCAYLIDHVDEQVDHLLTKKPVLTQYLNDMGSNLVFLEKVTLEKLQKSLADLDGLLELGNIRDNSFSDSFIGFDSFGSFDTFDSSDGGFDFDFGGGEGGGGGAGGDW